MRLDANEYGDDLLIKAVGQSDFVEGPADRTKAGVINSTTKSALSICSLISCRQSGKPEYPHQ